VRFQSRSWRKATGFDGQRLIARRLRILRRVFDSPAESGPGFSEKLLASVDAQLQKLKRPTCPFINLPEKTKGRWGLGITPAVMKRCQWVKPVLVAQVKFT
jgi:ATP dependent DNA ligase C terminal region